MREIKFRAWRKGHTPKMIRPYSLTMPVSGDWIGATGEVETIGVNHYDKGQDEFVLMQFTGLKDMNGQEIYEGDIVSSEFNAPEEYFNAVGIVKWCESDGARYVVSDNFDEKDPLTDWYASCEVIGNIHENPELLEAAND